MLSDYQSELMNLPDRYPMEYHHSTYRIKEYQVTRRPNLGPCTVSIESTRAGSKLESRQIHSRLSQAPVKGPNVHQNRNRSIIACPVRDQPRNSRLLDRDVPPRS